VGLIMSIEGVAELRQRLDPARFRQVLLEATRSSLEPSRAAIAAAAPVAAKAHRRGKSPGALARSITITVGGRGPAVVASLGSGVGYGHLVEKEHRMVIGGRVARLRPWKGHHVVSGKLTGRVIGQVAAHPFARPAWDATEPQFVAGVQEQLAAALNAP
jgi:bacteriophage HK97-gp10 putative tail-component